VKKAKRRAAAKRKKAVGKKPAKRAAARKTTAKKRTAKKTAAKKATVRKASVKKTPPQKTVGKKQATPTSQAARDAKAAAIRDAATRSVMGALRPMRVSDGFRALVLDNLSALGDVTPRPMFGGIGLYSRGLFFGIVASDVLYLKADDQLRELFEQAGATAFQPFANRPMSMNYFSVPPRILESPDDLLAWAQQSIVVASRV